MSILAQVQEVEQRLHLPSFHPPTHHPARKGLHVQVHLPTSASSTLTTPKAHETILIPTRPLSTRVSTASPLQPPVPPAPQINSGPL